MASELKHTVKPADGDFTSLDACLDHLVASHANLVTADVYANVEIDGTWSSSDTSACTTNGITADATRYLSIYTTAAARHDGKWDTGAYNLLVSNAVAFTYRGGTNCRLDGLQIGLSSVSAHEQAAVYVALVGAGSVLWLSNCLLKQAGNASYRCPCLLLNDADITAHVWNTGLFGMGSVDHAGNSCISIAAATALNLYNSVAIGGKYAIRCASGTATVKNTYGGGAITEDFYRSGGTLAKTNCASEDQSADDTSGADETQSNCIAAAVALSTDTFTNVTGGSENFHLKGTGSALYHTGVNTSGDAAPLNFTTDIDGDTYYSTRSIGIDEIVAAGPSPINNISGIATGYASGTAQFNGNVKAAGGIASAAAFGTASIIGKIVAVGAIASALAFGTPQLNGNVKAAGGIASAEALGSAKISGTVLAAGGIASAEAVGEHAVQAAAGGVLTDISGVATGYASGTAMMRGTIQSGIT